MNGSMVVTSSNPSIYDSINRRNMGSVIINNNNKRPPMFYGKTRMVRRRSDDPPPPPTVGGASATGSGGTISSSNVRSCRSVNNDDGRNGSCSSAQQVSFSDNVEIHIIPCWNEHEVSQLYYNENEIARFQYEANYESIEDYIFQKT